MDYIKRMNDILAEKVAEGMTGIRFHVAPEANTMEFAHDFCLMEDASAHGFATTTNGPLCL